MIRLILLLLFLMQVFLVSGQAQYKISFGYDSAGNQILRDRVCINCSAKTQTDSTEVIDVSIDEDISAVDVKENNTTVSDFMAYPNPVTNRLTVEWVKSGNKVERVQLFSGTGQQLQDNKVVANRTYFVLNFDGYAPGGYITMIVYADGSRQSFHVLKK